MTSMVGKAVFCGVCVGALACLVAREAVAFRTGADLAEFRPAGSVSWAPSAASFVVAHRPSGIPVADLTRAIQQAFGTWNQVPCSKFRFDFRGSTQAPAKRDDGLNTIEWVETGWENLGLAGTDAAGVTDISYVRHPDAVLFP